jgi:glucans biosynthesis protein
LRGFGLLQRDRNFFSYQDTEAQYHRRPGVWVEPAGDWGAGRIRLTELPAQGEYGDNIVACWEPAQPLTPGTPLDVSWTLHWFMDDRLRPPLARCVNTFAAGSRVLLDFVGENLRDADAKTLVADVTCGNGTVRNQHVMANPDLGGWRVGFDVTPAGTERTVELTVTLRDTAGRALSETWMYQLTR